MEFQRTLTSEPLLTKDPSLLAPLRGIYGSNPKGPRLEILTYLFLKTKNTGAPKLPQKGRLKRKVLKKVLKKNKVQD